MSNYATEVEDRIDAGDYHPTNSKQTPNAVATISGVRLREISSVAERERAQTAS